MAVVATATVELVGAPSGAVASEVVALERVAAAKAAVETATTPHIRAGTRQARAQSGYLAMGC